MALAAAIGGAFLASTVDLLLKKLASPETLHFFKTQKLNDKQLEDLKAKMRSVSELLNDAEDKQITNSYVKDWLDELKDAVYEAEDFFDELAFVVGRLKLEAGSQSQTCISQIRSFLSSLIPCKKGRKEMGSKLEEICQTLERLLKQKDDLGLEVIQGKPPFVFVPKTSSPEDCDFLGRNDDLEAIVKLLLSADASGQKIQISPSANDVSQRNALNNSKSFGSFNKFFSAFLPGSRTVSRATSLTSRLSSPPRATTPTPTRSPHELPKLVVDGAARLNDSLREDVVKLRAQVEELTHKAQLQDVELERTTKQLKEAIAVAAEETAKCKAAKEVIKSLTAQLKDFAERVPVGAAKNINSPSFYYSTNTPPRAISPGVLEQLSFPTCHEQDSKGSNSLVLSNVSGTPTNQTVHHSEVAHIEATVRNKNRTAKVEPTNGDEWVEQDEPGVYITLVSLPGGAKDLKRVRFSRKLFSEKQAEQWWAANRARVYQQYNVPMGERALVSVGREGLAH